jgi:DNA replication protein DnaC
VLAERLVRHLAYLGLTHTISRLDDLLAWATKERPDYTSLLERVLSAEVDYKSAARIRRHDDLVITGKAGTGKSHVLKALGLRSCVQGISLRYARCVDLLADLHAGLADNSYPRRLKAWARPELLIIDLREWGRYLGDATVAAAILDRLAMHAIRIDVDGPSYRQHVATERAGRRQARPVAP